MVKEFSLKISLLDDKFLLLWQDAVSHLQKDSSVILISSISGYSPPASMAMYGVTKTALLGLTKVGNAGAAFIQSFCISLFTHPLEYIL